MGDAGGSSVSFYAADMFVDSTPNGELLNAGKKVEDIFRIAEDKRIRFVDKSSRNLVAALKLADPFRDIGDATDCAACKKSSKFDNCRKMNIGYQITCNKCKNRGISKV